MLVPVEAKLLELAANQQCIRKVVIGAPGVVHQDHVVTDCLAHEPAHLDVLFNVGRPARNRVTSRRIPVVVGVDLVGAVPELFAFEGVIGVVPRLSHVWIRACVGQDAVPTPAQQLVQRDPGDAGGQVPEGYVDCAQGVLGNLRRPHPVPEFLAVKGIETQEHRLDPVGDM